MWQKVYNLNIELGEIFLILSFIMIVPPKLTKISDYCNLLSSSDDEARIFKEY